MAPRIYRLTWLGNALTILFSATALLLAADALGGATVPTGASTSSGLHLHVNGIPALLVGLLALTTVVLFLNWFYRARKNAGLTSWQQRWSPGWAIGGWFVPPVLLWFPYQIMADIWRAGRVPDRRQGAANATLPGLWWALWVLAWITSLQHRVTHVTHGPVSTTTSSYNLNFGGTTLGAAFAAAAAIVLVIIIRTVTAGPLGHPLTGVPFPAADDTVQN